MCPGAGNCRSAENLQLPSSWGSAHLPLYMQTNANANRSGDVFSLSDRPKPSLTAWPGCGDPGTLPHPWMEGKPAAPQGARSPRVRPLREDVGQIRRDKLHKHGGNAYIHRKALKHSVTHPMSETPLVILFRYSLNETEHLTYKSVSGNEKNPRCCRRSTLPGLRRAK